MTLTFASKTVIAVAIAILATLILKVRKTMINCKTCRNTKNCVYAGADREMEECVDRIPTTHSDIIRSMTDEELAELFSGEHFFPWCTQNGEPCRQFYKDHVHCDECMLDWLREEVEA